MTTATLFDSAPETDGSAPPAPTLPPDLVARLGTECGYKPEEVADWARDRALIVLELANPALHGYDPKKLKSWSMDKLQVVLAKRRKEIAKDVNHGAAAARGQEEATGPGGLLGMRLMAAKWLEESIGTASDEMLFALVYALHPLGAPELEDVARAVVVQLRIDPATGEKIVLPLATEPAPGSVSEIPQ